MDAFSRCHRPCGNPMAVMRWPDHFLYSLSRRVTSGQDVIGHEITEMGRNINQPRTF